MSTVQAHRFFTWAAAGLTALALALAIIYWPK